MLKLPMLEQRVLQILYVDWAYSGILDRPSNLTNHVMFLLTEVCVHQLPKVPRMATGLHPPQLPSRCVPPPLQLLH